MKNIVFFSLILAIFALFFPIVLSLGDSSAAEEPIGDIVSPSPTTASNATEQLPEGDDHTVTVQAMIEGKVQELTLDEYLIGVVAAEMPVSFDLEALKAQAVAARTYTLHKMYVSPSDSHPDADVCDDPGCCKAYADLNALTEKWGSSFEANLQKITDAVTSTDGICLLYDSQPALAVFHSSSSGATEDSANVWGSPLPYLHSVESPESADHVPNYVSQVEISSDDFKSTFEESFPEAGFEDDPSLWVTDTAYTDSGRLISATIGGISIDGTQLRSLFSLRSTAITIEATDESILFTTTGYGHGVGMSQYGANVLAQDGYTYDEILNWYYGGTELAEISDIGEK